VDFARGLARQNPVAKSADFAAVRKAYPIGTATAYERLMVNDQGEILEGISSNFYGVRAEVLFTAGVGVLEGITRRILLELAEQLGIQVVQKPVQLAEIDQLDEAAISSSSRGLLPVVKIDDHVIGDGRPGPVCRRLMAAYDAFVKRGIKTAV
jgi:branched-chain amino acid aminotransferase